MATISYGTRIERFRGWFSTASVDGVEYQLSAKMVRPRLWRGSVRKSGGNLVWEGRITSKTPIRAMLIKAGVYPADP